jgi:hypothetical protein
VIAYLLHRRSEAGARAALHGVNDGIHLANVRAKGGKKRDTSTGDADLDAFAAWAGRE